MKSTRLRTMYTLALALATPACGTGTSGMGGPQAADNSGSSSGGSSTSGASDSGGGAMAAMDPDVAYAATLTMNSFQVGAGQEAFMCQDFANPFNGQQADIKTYKLAMAPGSHHMFAFYKQGATDGPLAVCPMGGLQFGPFTFVAQRANVTQTYPQGVGATIPADTGFTLMVHYANVGSMPLVGQVSLTMDVAKPGIITQHAGVLFLNQLSLAVPPSASVSSPYTASATYVLGQDINILTSEGHMHQRATNFVATASTGQTIFQTTQWDEPPGATYSPPLQLTAGTSITWSCTYVNNTGHALTFGPSAQSNVMCISQSTFFPVQDINHPVISPLVF
jgi:hypothetical protein